jgi:hypothetical protein
MSTKYKELLQLHPYMTTVVHKETDCEARLNFKNWYLHGGNAGETCPILDQFSNEGLFHLIRIVNSQNNKYWSAKIPC